MVEGNLKIDLPSVETLRPMTLWESVRHLFGTTIERKSGQEMLTVGAMGMLEGLYFALRDSGIEDAVSLLIDRRVIYHDREGHTRDLNLLLQAAEESGRLNKNFQEMHLVMACSHAGLQVILDMKVRALNPVGVPELEIHLSGRPVDLRAAAGEDAATYAERLRSFTADPANFRALCVALDELGSRLSQHIRRRLPALNVQQSPAWTQLLQPDRASLHSIGKAPWNGSAGWRDIPTSQRGSGGDRYGVYVYDPGWDFTNFLMWNAVMSHHHHPNVVVVDRNGNAASGDGIDSSQVQISSDGPSVDAAAMAADGWGGSATSESADGWGGSDVADGWGGSDVGDAGGDGGGGDGGGGDGGSSCGSSCGGGCGGGD